MSDHPPRSTNPMTASIMAHTNQHAAASTPIKSYSDFMRSLAAKYNNNESNASPSEDSSKMGFSPLNPFLGGFPAPFRVPINPQAYHSALANPLFQVSKDDQMRAAAAMMSAMPGMGFPSMMEQLSSTQALLNLAAARNSHPNRETSSRDLGDPPPAKMRRKGDRDGSPKRLTSPKTLSSPLDLSGSNPPSPARSEGSKEPEPQSSLELTDMALLRWSVQDVVDFVKSIDMCQEYSEVFADHHIDGSSLALLTDDHLTKRLGLKLGPALKLRSTVQSRFQLKSSASSLLGGCIHCSHCQEVLKLAVNRERRQPKVKSEFKTRLDEEEEDE